MKKKYLFIIISALVILFLILNKNSISNYYYNHTLEYSKTTDLAWKYNSWTLYYLNKDYWNSVDSFSEVLSDNRKDLVKNKELIFRTYYNLWNAFYKKGEIINLKKSIDFYTKAINIKTDEESVKNLEFVKEKLRELKYKQDKKKEKQNDSETSSKWQENKKLGENKEWKNKKKWEKKEENKWEWKKGKKNKEKWTKQDSKSENKWLSKESRKALEEQIKKLNKEQSKIWEYYNKNYKQDNKNDILEDFFSRGWKFDNDLLNEIEKDW